MSFTVLTQNLGTDTLRFPSREYIIRLQPMLQLSERDPFRKTWIFRPSLCCVLLRMGPQRGMYRRETLSQTPDVSRVVHRSGRQEEIVSRTPQGTPYKEETVKTL